MTPESSQQQVRAGFDAFRRRDRAALMALLHPEVVWYPALGPLLDQQAYRGPEEVCRLILEEIPSVIAGFEAVLHGVEDHDADTVLVDVTFRGTVASAGMAIEQRFLQVHRLRDGRPAAMRSYTTRQEALAALEHDADR